KVRDALPHLFGTDRPTLRRRRIVFFRLVVDKRAVGRTAATARGSGTNDAEDGEVVLHRGDADLGDVADHLTDALDLPVAFGTCAEHDVGVLGPANGVAAQGQRHHVEFDAETFHALAQFRQALDGPFLVEGPRGQDGANVVDAESGQHAQVGVTGVVLMTCLEEDFFRGTLLASRSGLGRAEGRRAGRRSFQEVSPIHSTLPLRRRRRGDQAPIIRSKSSRATFAPVNTTQTGTANCSKWSRTNATVIALDGSTTKP